jgi:hypothetical protein
VLLKALLKYLYQSFKYEVDKLSWQNRQPCDRQSCTSTLTK